MSAENAARRDDEEGWGDISRRALLKAGWTAPVILTVAPAVAFAASGTPPHSTTAVSANGGRNPNSTTPSGSDTPGSSDAGGSGGLPEQSSQGSNPARTNSGFTG